MNSVRLSDLPPPPPDRIGWPWTEEAAVCPPRMLDGYAWPRISVVTPSYNQGRFLEETIRSVLLQGYPDLEYLVLDGGSTDNSVEIIDKYRSFLAYSVSQPDGGPENAINDGWARSTGEFLAFLPSDDLYFPESLAKSAAALSGHVSASFVYGGFKVIDQLGHVLSSHDTQCPFDMTQLLRAPRLGAPAVLIRKSCLELSGSMDPGLRFISDWDLWIRLALQSPPMYASHWVAYARSWPGSKTSPGEVNADTAYVPFERATLLERLLKRQKFPCDMNAMVHNAIATHYVDWTYWLRAMNAWHHLPGAYAKAILHDPIYGSRSLFRDLLNDIRGSVQLRTRVATCISILSGSRK